MPIKEQCCYNCKHCIELYIPPIKDSVSDFEYYCMLHFESHKSIMKLGGKMNIIEGMCECFERK